MVSGCEYIVRSLVGKEEYLCEQLDGEAVDRRKESSVGVPEGLCVCLGLASGDEGVLEMGYDIVAILDVIVNVANERFDVGLYCVTAGGEGKGGTKLSRVW